MEDRLIELETRLAFQDDAVLKLEGQVSQLERTVLKLTEELREMRDQLATGSSSQVMDLADEAPPPHY